MLVIFIKNETVSRETINTTHKTSPKIDRSTTMERSLSFNGSEIPKETKTDSNNFDVLERLSPKKSTPNALIDIERTQITNPLPPNPFVPLTELDAAATMIQKIYKSYQTRRNLADCAVVVEELWRKGLDDAALKLSSISFEEEKHETAVSKWALARTLVSKVVKGLSKDEKTIDMACEETIF